VVRCLVTGATGYIGGRLAPRLIEARHTVRALTRSAARLRDVGWAAHSEVVEGDIPQRVPAVGKDQFLRVLPADNATDAGDVAVQGPSDLFRRVILPQQVDQPLNRDESTSFQQQDAEQTPLAPPRNLNCRAITVDLYRTEHPVSHRRRLTIGDN
jgi:NAD(P)-dependent dehydrogenase (short-subunit alcohol dehydrogenase family)